ncbi:MAG: roadblock/LC7 domain-containing protein [Methanomicrobiaceae archaeon]|nr:roadblock/LC7 domain-containing protein [Methanomicrobiaceae archaeon]
MPSGNPVADLECPLTELYGFCSELNVGVNVTADGGEGYLLIENGTIRAAFFTQQFKWYTGRRALKVLKNLSFLSCEILAYGPESLAQARELAMVKGWTITHRAEKQPEPLHDLLSRERLSQIANQPGVVAVSAFFEGFPVHTMGDVDFDQVTSVAEMLLRSGQKISGDLDMGPLDQIILENADGKIIIAPFGDLFLCVQATPAAHLGLIRLAIRGMS